MQIVNDLRKYIFLITILQGGIIHLTKGGGSIPDSIQYYTKQISEANRISTRQPEKSYEILLKSYHFFKKEKDSTAVINCLIRMSDIKKIDGKFSISFDHLWEAQYLSNITNNNDQIATTHLRLGRLYDEFGMDQQTLHHYEEALKVSKSLYYPNEEGLEQLIASYMNLAVRQRKLGHYNIALRYLDSCFVNNDVAKSSILEMPFWHAEKGVNMMKLKKYEEAKKSLRAAYKPAEKLKATYTPNINMFLGELYLALNIPDSANLYLKRSLKLIRTKNYRNDLEAEVIFKLSEVSFAKGYTKRAYEYLAESNAVAEARLKLINQTNSELFEMKNSYLKSISQKDELLDRQNIIIDHNQEIQLRLKIILVLVVILGIGLYIFNRMRIKLKRTLLDNKESELRLKLQEEKSQAEIDLKSRELTSYALQLINKDSAIDELLEALKKESDSAFNSMFGKLKRGSQDMWDEFNMRFTEVNSAFYDRLKSKHPSLSITEQKHCALLKLKFTTKEMARILLIETHSVHMSRSRIRKKIGLERSENLEEYIANL